MPKFKLLLIFFSVIISTVTAQIISISDARLQPIGDTVTINGILTSGDEFGTIRYLQDGTAGIAVFSPLLAGTQRGDHVTVTGVLSSFNNLLEITPVNSWLLNSSSNPLPLPELITPSGAGEDTESELIQINNVTFTTSGQFQGNANYNFTSGGESGVVYIRAGNPLVGMQIPTSNITLFGIISQFGNQYQVLPRDSNDLINALSISITIPPYPQNISTSGFEISWNTNVAGDNFIKYGLTPALELGIITGPSATSAPVVPVIGGLPSQVFYVQVFSVAGNDTAYSNVEAYITASNSSGVIKTYFNRPVDAQTAVPPSNIAVYLNNAFDDTLKAYMDRALSTLDIAIYSFDGNGTANIIQGINDAHARGVQVRIIADGNNANVGLTQLDPAIPILLSPTTPAAYYGIMHNKFFIIDANHVDANRPVVMTGSTNWSNGQLYNDRNNIVFIQDQSLAKVYQMEFEEMWGGSGSLPDVSNSRFGPDKKNNTPHEVNAAGTRIECFFSPSDDTNNQILRTIETAGNELYFATLVFTRFDLAYGIEERVSQHGVYAAGIMDDSANGGGTSFLIMQGVIGNNLLLFDHSTQPGILHHKYLIVDQGNINSDPLVLTGSHNWSSTANLRNDENIVVIHHAETANQFYQEFHNLHVTNGGSVGINNNEVFENVLVYPNPSSGKFNVVYNSSVHEKIHCQLTDVTGKICYNVILECSNGTTFLNLPEVTSAGMYILSISSERGIKKHKVIIQ